MQFEEFLRQRLAAGGFTTEDALATFLPLMRQTAETHGEGQVAPLEGLAALHVEGVQIWFERSRRLAPRNNRSRVGQVENQPQSSVEIREERRVRAEVGSTDEQIDNLAIGRRDEEIRRPVYLPGYVAWEHLVGHHDPLTDTFSLGLILASLACGLDLSDPEHLSEFVSHRRNLFQLNPQLHPVVGQAIVRMTELGRHARPQDLPSVLRALENYRGQDVDFAVHLAQEPEFEQRAIRDKRQVVLTKLKQRLFEISRRNRLLHFRPTLQTVNLTQASVPLSFDVRSIRPDQILTWNRKVHEDIAAGTSIALNGYLNFREAVYLPGVLDRIRTEAERDRNEYGFAQLRLVACFLRWANLKENPPEQFESPLVLVPVELTKKKGVRDTYWLKALDSVAEINPVVRHLFDELYDIDLPETIDLEHARLEELHESLAAQIAATEPAVNLELVDRPRIDLIHASARRRLDQYCRRVRLSGKGVRSFMDVDYSYDPANYHPLGLKLFSTKIRPATTNLKQIIDSKPLPRKFAVPSEEEPSAAPVAVREQGFYVLREGGDGNPFRWEFDLCNVTLGNFKYRKMSLVQDYATLLDEQTPNPAFDAAFSLAPRATEVAPPAAAPHAERFHVVPCDPTQAAAIAESRTGASYIIQGPPGTGKSQTITNLIADFVARGKRVLFVCEKRAAIDVVYHRLKQKGLDPLCCLIHDSQSDKKQFVQDLKGTYEAFLAQVGTRSGQFDRKRKRLLRALGQELQPLERFDAAMTSPSSASGLPLRQLLDRAIQLKESLPSLATVEQERVPQYAAWKSRREVLARFREALASVAPDGVLARHPLRLVRAAVKDHPRPVEFVGSCAEAASRTLETVSAAIGKSRVPADRWDTLAGARALVDYAVGAEFLARSDRLSLLDRDSSVAREFRSALAGLRKPADNLRARKEATAGWKQKLSPAETEIALAQARAFESDLLRFLKPAWWRLRAVLNRCYDLRAHQITPGWPQALEWLRDEYQAADQLTRAEAEICQAYGIDEPLGEFQQRLEQLARSIESGPAHVRESHNELARAVDGSRHLLELAAAAGPLETLQRQLDDFLEGTAGLSVAELERTLTDISDSLDELSDFVECLRALAELPPDMAAALRFLPFNLQQLEAASAARSVGEILRADRPLAQFDEAAYRRQVRALSRLSQRWEEINAQVVCERVCERFLEHVRISTLAAAQLKPEQKEFKKQFSRGRRELEHEFGKAMRFRPIREIVSGDSGLVARDLKPVWLMSPLSVSDTLPLDTGHFDVVIFDEASQIPLEEAVPSLFRATQTIVVGDEMQLPPTNFFSARREEDDELVAFEEDGEQVEYDLAGNSLLNHAARNLTPRMLGWHYRSRSESLISFSNWAFYGGRLLTVPEEKLPQADQPALVAASATDAVARLAESLDRPVSFHFLEHGLYENRRNRPEAEYIAAIVREWLFRETRPTIGIVAFSEAQQGEIEAALERLAADDQPFRDRLDEEFEREEDGQFAGLLVKNLENIQGDERDVIILSVCYGPGPEGKMRMNFGPINQSGGEKRLNVAFSRAKQHMAVVSSIRASAITNDFNDGANCLKNYLQYAEGCSAGDAAAARRVLAAMAPLRPERDRAAAGNNAVVAQLAAALRQRGYAVDCGVGQSHFQCDLAVRRPGDAAYRLGILVDGDEYYRQRDILERDLMKPRLLQQFGWRIAVVLAKSWWEAPEAVLAALVQSIEAGQPAEAGADEDDDRDLEFADSDSDADDLGDDNEASAAGGDEPAADFSLAAAHADDEGADSDNGAVPSDSAVGSTADAASHGTPSLQRRLEYVQGASAKFWEISVSGLVQTTRFGRLGSAGQTQTKTCLTPAIAERDALRQIEKKLAKGYQERSG